jgi:hypothetical protein
MGCIRVATDLAVMILVDLLASLSLAMNPWSFCCPDSSQSKLDRDQIAITIQYKLLWTAAETKSKGEHF